MSTLSSTSAASREHGLRAIPQVTRELVREAVNHDVMGMAAEMSYRFLLALPPLLIVIAALSGFVADWTGVTDPVGEIMADIGTALPSDAASVLEGQLRQVLDRPSGGLVSIGVVVALWAASGGTRAVMKGMNRAYSVAETRPLWRKYLVALAMTLLLSAAVLGGFLLLVVGQFFVEEIAEALFGQQAWAHTAVSLARWPIAALLVVVGTALLYWAAPNERVPFRWVTPGSLLFVLLWVIATAGFALYFEYYGSYDQTYGALAGVIVLLLWLYVTSAVLLIGAELNAILARRAGERPPDEPEVERFVAA